MLEQARKCDECKRLGWCALTMFGGINASRFLCRACRKFYGIMS